jgi:hypothetical protein
MRLLRMAGGATLFLCELLLAPAYAQTDEIQVYTGEINKPNEFSITLHDNYTPIGPTQPAFIGGVVPNHSLNGVPEYALGITPWLEFGAYLPLYTITGEGQTLIDGAKLRALFVSPNAVERTFWYGVNFEQSYNARHWQEARYALEIRPILGWRFGSVDLLLNPIIDFPFHGGPGALTLLRRAGSPIIYPRPGHSQSSTMLITEVRQSRTARPAVSCALRRYRL